MNWINILKVAIPVLVVIALGFCFIQWQNARQEVGEWKAKYQTQTTYAAGLTNQLADANKKINSTAHEGAVSYGHCQDLVANDAAKNFDIGVTFGRATCPASSVSPAVSALRSQPAPNQPAR
jgi:hypothetical protein